jgi:hypothetical protein
VQSRPPANGAAGGSNAKCSSIGGTDKETKKMSKTKSDYSAIFQQLAANTRELLEDYYAKAFELRDSKDTVKIGIVHKVSTNSFGETVTNSKIAFGKRIRDEVEHAIDKSPQLFEGKEGNGAP